jgi:hypothetical protein
LGRQYDLLACRKRSAGRRDHAATVIKSNTFIIWRGGTPADFELKLDYRITEAGNSGINYRSVVVPDTVTPGQQVRDEGLSIRFWTGRKRYDGNNYEEKGRLFLACAVRCRTSSAAVRRSCNRPSGRRTSSAERHHVRLESRRTSSRAATPRRTFLNGRLMSITVDDDAPNRKLDGSIGMQVHVGPPMKIEYRNIRLKRW